VHQTAFTLLDTLAKTLPTGLRRAIVSFVGQGGERYGLLLKSPAAVLLNGSRRRLWDGAVVRESESSRTRHENWKREIRGELIRAVVKNDAEQ
jgi:hypothetical protein